MLLTLILSAALHIPSKSLTNFPPSIPYHAAQHSWVHTPLCRPQLSTMNVTHLEQKLDRAAAHGQSWDKLGILRRRHSRTLGMWLLTTGIERRVLSAPVQSESKPLIEAGFKSLLRESGVEVSTRL